MHSFGKRDQAIRRNPNVPVVVRGWLHKQVRRLRKEGGQEEVALADFFPHPGPPGGWGEAHNKCSVAEFA